MTAGSSYDAMDFLFFSLLPMATVDYTTLFCFPLRVFEGCICISCHVRGLDRVHEGEDEEHMYNRTVML
jgi:hypothetical protein